MKALKIIGGILAAIGIAVLIFYIGWLRAPSADAVCDNLASITKKETGVELSAQDREQCIRHAKPPEFGRIPWVKSMKCLRDASSMADVKACK